LDFEKVLVDFEKTAEPRSAAERSANRVSQTGFDSRSELETDADEKKAPASDKKKSRTNGNNNGFGSFSESDRAGGITRRAVDGRASPRATPPDPRFRQEIPLARREVSEETNALRRVSTA